MKSRSSHIQKRLPARPSFTRETRSAMTSKTKRVLVTGGTGFIGRHVTAGLLARGFEVHLVARDPDCDVAASSGAVLHRCDLFDGRLRATVIRDVAPTHLLHLAWYTVHGKLWNSSENLSWAEASLDLVQQFIACGGRRVVCAGTCAEYDWSFQVCSEATTPTRPATLYGKCKNRLREMTQQHASLHGVSTAWGRLFFVYGPYESQGRLVPSLMLPLSRGDSAECRYCDHVRDLLQRRRRRRLRGAPRFRNPRPGQHRFRRSDTIVSSGAFDCDDRGSNRTGAHGRASGFPGQPRCAYR